MYHGRGLEPPPSHMGTGSVGAGHEPRRLGHNVGEHLLRRRPLGLLCRQHINCPFARVPSA